MNWKENVDSLPNFKMLDLGTLKELDEFSFKKESLALEIVKLYLEISPQQFVKLNEYFKAGAFLKMSSEAHSLKSSSASIGALVVASLCHEVERLGKKSEPIDANVELKHLLESLKSHFQLLIEELEVLKRAMLREYN